ncbi:MAG: hypothetical protein ABI380_14870 [Edaphobacter sp.]
MPLTDPVAKPVMAREQILALLGAIEDAHDLCLMFIGVFCGPRASEALGLQWKCWTGEALMPSWDGLRGAVLQRTAQDEGQQGSHPSTGASQACH